MLTVRASELDPEVVLRAVARGMRPFLLDGAGPLDGGDGLARYSYAGCDPDDGIVWRPGDAGDPFALLEDAQRRWSVGPVDEHWPIAIGYVSYDAAASALARTHGRSLHVLDDLGLPGVDFARYRAIWRLDRQRGVAEILAHDSASAEQLLSRLGRSPVPLHPTNAGALVPLWSRDEYDGKVRTILEHLHAGDAYQVNLAQRLVARCEQAGGLALYLALRKLAPAPLGVYLETDGATILSNTPERLLRVSARKRDGRYELIAETRPIKGTAPRGSDAASDAARARELLASEKDAAEHLMIVDLLRNDLGRVARIGSVRAEGPRLLTLPTLHHLASTVEADVGGAGLAALLAATLPGGSVTGAPKLRAVEIIAALEGRARGVYCGAIGWLGAGRALDFALPIRTGVLRGGELLVPVGGGVVVDSTPEGEWQETMVKALAWQQALSASG